MGMNPKKEVPVLSEKRMLLKEWEKRLGETGVPLDEWGEGEAKTLNHFVEEVLEGELKVSFDKKENKWIREVKTVEVGVFYESPDGTLYRLEEDRQVFNDGRVRRRGFFWVAEKMKKGEDFLPTAKRAMKEELDLLSPFALGPEHMESKAFEQESKSYPGLITKYSIDCFEVYLTPEQFRPEGYVEEQEKLTTFFVWERK